MQNVIRVTCTVDGWIRLGAVAEHGVPGFMLQCRDVEVSQALLVFWQRLLM